MKYQHVHNYFCLFIFTLSIFFLPLTVQAAIEHTEMVFYDLATDSQRSYAVNLLPTGEGAHLSLHRSDGEQTLLMDIKSCFSNYPSGSGGYLRLKEGKSQHTDPDLAPFLNFVQNNRLRVAMKPLTDTQSVLLDKDTLTVMVVDPALMTLGIAGCQR